MGLSLLLLFFANPESVKRFTIPEGKPLTFSGQSYARWRLSGAMQRRFSLSLDVRTVQKSARLVHAVGRVDYSLLEVKRLY